MLNAINVPYHPSKHFLRTKNDLLKFTLIFPKLPIEWKTFDFVEECGNYQRLKIHSIPRNNTGVYNIDIS